MPGPRPAPRTGEREAVAVSHGPVNTDTAACPPNRVRRPAAKGRPHPERAVHRTAHTVHRTPATVRRTGPPARRNPRGGAVPGAPGCSYLGGRPVGAEAVPIHPRPPPPHLRAPPRVRTAPPGTAPAGSAAPGPPSPPPHNRPDRPNRLRPPRPPRPGGSDPPTVPRTRPFPGPPPPRPAPLAPSPLVPTPFFPANRQEAV